MSEIEMIPPKRKDKISTMVAVPVSPSMKADIKSMMDDADVNEMTRKYWEQAIAQWKNRKVS